MPTERVVAAHLGRRKLLGMCCAAHALMARPSWAQTGQKVFICTTPEPQQTPGIEIEQYIAQSGINVADLTARAAGLGIKPYGVGFVRDRWRQGDGIYPNPTGNILLGICFLKGSEDAKALIRRTAPEWLLGNNPPPISFRFDVPRQDAQLRIAFDRGKGNWSQVGRTNLDVAQDQPTMNIADLDTWVVRHEFGHALGLQHELMHPSLPFQWEEKVVLAEVEASNPTWTDDYTRRNIMSRFSASSGAECVSDPGFNRNSVMMYEVPKNWTVGGVFSQPLNREISTGDRLCLSGIYKL